MTTYLLGPNDDPDKVFAEELANQEAAAKKVKPWQTELKAGDFFLVITRGGTVYGEVLDPVGHYRDTHKADVDEEGDLEELEGIVETWAQPHMVNYRFTRTYSPLSPNGWLGDIHLTEVSLPLSKEQFGAARLLGWPTDGGEAMAIIYASLQPYQGEILESLYREALQHA
jgi:hypothetical protein